MLAIPDIGQPSTQCLKIMHDCNKMINLTVPFIMPMILFNNQYNTVTIWEKQVTNID